MDHESCLQVLANSPTYQESPSRLAFQVLQPLCGCTCAWLQNRKGKGVAQPSGNTTQALSGVHTFLRSPSTAGFEGMHNAKTLLRSNVSAVVWVVQIHQDTVFSDDGVNRFLERLEG